VAAFHVNKNKKMILFKKANDLIKDLRQQKSIGRQVGFVPTMGALHPGHLSLIETSKKQTGLTICSIFVNPTQFNDPKDFQKYPQTLEQDIYQLERAGTDFLFLPEVAEMYPEGFEGLESYDLGYLETILEGKYRPGHFQGVCQIMHRFLKIVEPDHIYMGQKDYQQCMVIKRLLQEMQSEIVLHNCPTKREKDGLAMSSRNMRLNSIQRQNATGIFKALTFLKKNIQPGNLADPINQAIQLLTKNNFKIDYVEISNARTLQPVRQWDGKQNLIALVAAFQDEIRLIDNMILNDELN
jgi:pantoate--beta-alanine ligase